MASIIEFLEARIAEDEVRARGDDAWHTVDCGVGLGYWALPDCQCDGPARVLAECAAKRELVETWYDEHGGGHVLRTLATVYKDHPGYQQEWAA